MLKAQQAFPWDRRHPAGESRLCRNTSEGAIIDCRKGRMQQMGSGLTMNPSQNTNPVERRGWHSRGYLPHFDGRDFVQTVTFRLADAVPERVVDQWKEELQWIEGLPAMDAREVELRKRIAKYEDAGHGKCFLRIPELADLVEGAMLHFDAERYRLLGWTVMPNHVHVIIEPLGLHELEGIVHSWKSFTGLQANRRLNRSGAFWFRDYYDRFVRDHNHLLNAIRYIDNNPVKAGLVSTPNVWAHCSARRNCSAAGGTAWTI